MDQIKCECPICLNIFERPRGLPCLHNFCTKCLQQHIDNNREGETFCCPLCRIYVTPPDTSMPSSTWASSFPIANVVNELMEALRINQQNKSSADNCAICLRQQVNYFCNTCKMILCQKCSDTHSIESPGHKLMIDKNFSVMHQPQNEDEPSCTIHKNTALDLFCLKCDTFICIKCTYGGHASCSKDRHVRDIHHLAQEKRDIDQIQVAKLENGIDEMNKLVKDIETEQENLLLSKEKKYTEVDKIIDAMIQLLEKKRANEKSSLEQVFNTRHKYLENTSDFAKKRLEGLNVCISKLKTNLEIENKFVYLCESKNNTVKVVDTLFPLDFSVKSNLCFSVDPEFYLIFDKMEQLDIGNAFLTLDADVEKIPWCNFETPEKLTIKVYSAEITKTKVGGIVIPTDDQLTHSQELSRRIIKAAGPAISAANKEIFKSRGGTDHFELTDVYVTQAGKLDFNFILHAVLPTYPKQIISKEQSDFENLITQTVRNSLFVANSLQLQSIALPSFCFSYDIANSCAKGYLRGVLEFSETHCTNSTNTLREVHFVDSNLRATHHIQTVFKKRLKIIHDITV